MCTHPTAKSPEVPTHIAHIQPADLLLPRGLVHHLVEICHRPRMDQMTVDILLVRKGSRLCLRNGDEFGLASQ